MARLSASFFNLVLLAGLAGCEPGIQGGGPPAGAMADARRILDTFCRLKVSEIGQVLLTDEQRRAGAVVCGAIGDRLGQ